jgi:caa(3)-type oxidase subunit IV
MARDNHGSVGTYILIALILGVVTYFEYALVEYPQAWLGSTMTYVALAALSVLKFVLVVMFFMHLKNDDRMYSGFFSSGMVIALATFIAMTAMFLLPRAMSYGEARARAESLEGRAAHGEAEVPEDVAALIESDGASRPAAERADVPAPVDRSVPIEAPRAANDGSDYEVGEPQAAAPPAPAAAAQGEEAAAAQEEAEEPAAPAEAAQAADWDRELGNQVFAANCVGCHQANGQGIPGAFPPLAGHAAEVYAAGGREYLPQVLLYGLQGPIQVEGMTYNGMMPAWGHLSDDQIAAVINHVVAELGDAPEGFVPYTADDVAAHRGDELTSAEVHEVRDQLGLD